MFAECAVWIWNTAVSYTIGAGCALYIKLYRKLYIAVACSDLHFGVGMHVSASNMRCFNCLELYTQCLHFVHKWLTGV